MTANRYASTSVAAYLRDRFNFAFTGAEHLAVLEDVIWEQARKAQVARHHAESIAAALVEDAGYALKSMDPGANRPDIYEVPDRGSLPAAIRAANERERDLRQWLGAVAGIGEVARQGADLRGEIDSLRGRVTLLAEQRAELERGKMAQADELAAAHTVIQDLLAQGAALGEQIGGLEAALEAEQRKVAEAREVADIARDDRDWLAEQVRTLQAEVERHIRDLAIRSDQLQSWTDKANRLEGQIEGLKRDAENFADERDDAERARRVAVDEHHEKESELETAREELEAARSRIAQLEEIAAQNR